MSWVAVSTPRLAFWRACAPCRYFASARPPCASPAGAFRRLPGLSRGPPAAPRSVLSRRVHEAATRARQGVSVPAGIELIVGPMFSGKTTALLRRVEELERAGLSVALVKSSKDDRYSQEHVVTHNGLSRPCYAVRSLAALPEALQDAWRSVQVIALDEAQFIPDLLEGVTASVDGGRRWIIAGLDGDFQRRPIGQVLDLIPHADEVQKLKAHCHLCLREGVTRDAPFTLRYSADTESRQEVVGGAELYAPACRFHFLQHTARKESDSTLELCDALM